MAIQEGVPRHGGRREGAGRRPALIAELGAALEDADVYIEAARALLRTWRATLLTARGAYAHQFAAPPSPSYRAAMRRARRRVAMAPVRRRRAR